MVIEEMKKQKLLPIGRLINLNNESEIAEIHLEGLVSTHQVIGHTNETVIVRSINGKRIRELFNFDVNYLLPNDYGGYYSNTFKFRVNLINRKVVENGFY